MPGKRLSDGEILEKLRGLLRLKYGRLNYLGKKVRFVSEKTKRRICEEVYILLKTNQDRPIRSVLREEDFQWLIQFEPEHNQLDKVREPVSLEAAVYWQLGEYYANEESNLEFEGLAIMEG